MKALSLRQPWAWAVVHGGKTIENRRWSTRFRGRFLIHAAKGMTREEYEDAREFCEDVGGITYEMPAHDSPEIHRGGIVGAATLTDCVPPRPEFMSIGVKHHYPPYPCGDDFQWRWHMREQYGFVLANVVPIVFAPWKGELGFFEVPDDKVRLLLQSTVATKGT